MQHRHRHALLALALLAAMSEWTAASAQTVDVESLKAQVLALLDEQRAVSGAPPLQRVAALDAAAQSYSELMRDATAGGPVFLSHTGPDGSTLADRVTATGYDWYRLAEDLGAGQATPDQVVAQWMSSTAHRANILNPDFGDVGIGIAVGPGTWSDGRYDPQVIWWTVDFGQGAGSAGQPNPFQPAPSAAVTSYAALDGTPIAGAPFGSLVMISGQNLGLGGGVAFDGQPTSALAWMPTAILAIVPLQLSYPDTGPVTITTAGQTAVGPSFTTVQPGSPVPVPDAPPPVPEASAGAAPPPSIRELDDSANHHLLAVPPGTLFFIHGSGFGANLLSQSRVVFLLPTGAQVDAAVLDWSDSMISVFAPFTRGPIAVAVQVNDGGTPVTSNRASLTIN